MSNQINNNNWISFSQLSILMEEDPWYGEFWREDNGNFKWEIINNRHDYEYFGIHNQISTQNPFKFWIHIEGLPLYEKNYDETYSRANICIPKAQNLLNDLLFQKNFNGLYLNKDELEDFLLNLRLPLPAFWFKGSPVNTERFCAGQCIDSDFDIAKQIKEKTGEIQEWKKAKPITVSEKEKKEEKIHTLAQEIYSFQSQIGNKSHHETSLPNHKNICCDENSTDINTISPINEIDASKIVVALIIKMKNDAENKKNKPFTKHQLAHKFFPDQYPLDESYAQAAAKRIDRMRVAGEEKLNDIDQATKQSFTDRASKIFTELAQTEFDGPVEGYTLQSPK